MHFASNDGFGDNDNPFGASSSSSSSDQQPFGSPSKSRPPKPMSPPPPPPRKVAAADPFAAVLERTPLHRIWHCYASHWILPIAFVCTAL
jgi:hypothetical protein